MINKVMGSAISNVARVIPSSGGGATRTQKFMRSEALGKVLDVAAENQTLCQSLFALGICVGPRPLTNFAITEDKQDATYASCHSIASGGVGFVWPLVFATPIAVGVKRMAANPTKYFKPEMIQKFYPNVGVKYEVAEDGKKVAKIITNKAGEMLRKDGTVLCKDLEPLMMYGKEAAQKFEKAHHDLYVDGSGVVRSKTVFKTEKGIYKLDKNGNKIGAAVQKTDMHPITEEMEIGAMKEQNVQKFVNMVPDILLAPARASLTIAMIPPLLGMFGIEKRGKGKAPASSNQTTTGLNIVSNSNNTVTTGGKPHFVSTFSSFKKGGV